MLFFPVALALLVAQPAASTPPGTGDIYRAADLIAAGKPAEAVALLDTVIAGQERERSGENRQVYCARSAAEGLVYSGAAAQAKRAAVVLPQESCYSIFLKGYALIDLNRRDEAKVWLERAVAMAPSNAHFLGELGEWYKIRKDWATARALFQRAVDASALSPENRQVFDKVRGMRGLGYILIEEGRLDEAEKIYRQCLQLDPTDERARRQLDYIAGQRAKKT